MIKLASALPSKQLMGEYMGRDNLLKEAEKK